MHLKGVLLLPDPTPQPVHPEAPAALFELHAQQAEAVRLDTLEWLEQAVIGLDLCPFAKPVYRRGLLRLALTAAANEEQLFAELEQELNYLAGVAAQSCETTLIVLPAMLDDFLDFHLFLRWVEQALARWQYRGIFQVAAFHPGWQFAGVAPEDISHWTNRSPYPSLQLLREASVEYGVRTLSAPEQIYARNIQRLQALDAEGVARLKGSCRGARKKAFVLPKSA